MRSCYSTLMRFPGMADPVKVRWYFTDKEFLNVPTVYNSRNWLTDKLDEQPFGEIRGIPRVWADGKKPPTHDCTGPGGSPAAWLGNPVSLLFPLPLWNQLSDAFGEADGNTAAQYGDGWQTADASGDADGATADQSASFDHDAAGGDADGATAVQYGDGWSTATGGDADGATARHFGDAVQNPTDSGDADDGSADQWEGFGQDGDGGDADDGTARQFGDERQTAAGGDADDGSASQGPVWVQPAAGGDADGLEADQWQGFGQDGDGGDADDGSATQRIDWHQTGDGGDADDGSAGQQIDWYQAAAGGDADGNEAHQAAELPTHSWAGCSSVSLTLYIHLHAGAGGCSGYDGGTIPVTWNATTSKYEGSAVINGNTLHGTMAEGFMSNVDIKVWKTTPPLSPFTVTALCGPCRSNADTGALSDFCFGILTVGFSSSP